MADTVAVEMVERGIATMLEGLRRLRKVDTWIDQHRSPIGKRQHLSAVREGKVAGCKVGRLVLVKSGDLDAYIEQHRVHRLTVDEDRDEEAEIDEIVNAPAPPRRRRKKGGR